MVTLAIQSLAFALVISPAIGLAVTTDPPKAHTIWVEAEHSHRSSLERHPFWYDQVKKDQLSGGDWISNWSDDNGRCRRVRRLGPRGRSLPFLDPGQSGADACSNMRSAGASGRPSTWRPMQSTRSTSRPTTSPTCGSWRGRRLAKSPLAKGQHTIAFRMSSENHHHGAIDAFVLTTEPFLPSGTTAARRSEGQSFDQAGTWPFLPERDTFQPDAVFDLREPEREGRRAEWVRPAEPGWRVVRSGRRHAGPVLGRDHLRSARPVGGRPGPSRPLPGQARGEHGPAPRRARIQGQEREAHRRRSEDDRRRPGSSWPR